MPRTPRDVTEAELTVLGALWDHGPASRRELTDRLYPGGEPSSYATVQKLLERLEAKGCVRRAPTPGVLMFAAAVSREELISRRLRDVADALCGGSLTPLLMNLVRAKPLTPGELDELRSLVADLGRRENPKGGGRR
jgi:predicted transcriptional regulator